MGSVSTYLIDYERKLTPATVWLSLVNTAGQPVDLRAKASATWTQGSWSVTGGLNYVDDYATASGVRIDRWTTLDAQVAWRASGETTIGWPAIKVAEVEASEGRSRQRRQSVSHEAILCRAARA